MDRGSSKWPGGPVLPAPYPHERLGGKYAPHEIGHHGAVVKREILVNAVADGGDSSCTAGLWMSVPDARLLAVLSIVFEPDVVEGLGVFYGQTIHLAATEDFERTPIPVEDLLGTAAVPTQLVQAGLRGLVYSPTEEVAGMRADLSLVAPTSATGNNGAGKWIVQARWQALRPMAEIEWAEAVSKMVLLRDGGIKQIGLFAPG